MKDRESEAQAFSQLVGGLGARIEISVVGDCASERLAFCNFELASLVETHIGKQLNPEAFDESARTYWSRKFETYPSCYRSRPQHMWFWLMAEQGRIGTLSCSS